MSDQPDKDLERKAKRRTPIKHARSKEKHGLCANGQSLTVEYRTWSRIKERCYNPNHPKYHRYGGRGIQVCAKWRVSFTAFLKDMGSRPAGKYTIERIDNDGHYAPSNCKWATYKEQENNRGDNRIIEFENKSGTLAQWADWTGMAYSKLQARLINGWSIRKALTT